MTAPTKAPITVKEIAPLIYTVSQAHRMWIVNATGPRDVIIRNELNQLIDPAKPLGIKLIRAVRESRG